MSMADTHRFPKENLATPSNQRTFIDTDGDTDALSLFPGSPSRFSNKYNDDRYRSLVQESPPAGFHVRTPTTDERKETSNFTPKSKNSNHTEEFKTAQEWDEVMRCRRNDTKTATTTSPLRRPKHHGRLHDQETQQSEHEQSVQTPVRELTREAVRPSPSTRELPMREPIRRDVHVRESIREPIRCEPPGEAVTNRSPSVARDTPLDNPTHEPAVRVPMQETTRDPIHESVRTPVRATTVQRLSEPEPPMVEDERMGSSEPSVGASSQQQQQRQHTRRIPSYMRSTQSYESRILSSRPTAQRQPMPYFRSSTRINAMEDIRSEMDDEDIYVPLAVRVRLFEQGLGNSRYKASAPRPAATHKEPNSRPRLTRARSPNLRTSYRSTSINQRRLNETTQETIPKPLTTESTNTRMRTTYSSSNSSSSRNQPSKYQSSVPARTTVPKAVRSRHGSENTSARSRDSTQEPETISKTKRQKTHHSRLEVKPFRFATDERALHHQKAFQAKLELWKKKELEQGSSQGHGTRGTKRKVRDD